MNSRCGLWIVCVCWIGLAGCANWQNRLGNTGPGTAAAVQPVDQLGGPAVSAAPGVSPGTVFNEPPPPMPPPPSDPGATLAPLGSAPGQKLDLSATSENLDDVRPEKMYNLESSPRRTASSSAPNAARSSTISKLASKAGTSSSRSEANSSGLSTVQRLSADASESRAGSSSEKSSSDAAPAAPGKEPKKVVEPAPRSAAKKDAAPVIDTTLLAQPVRKGAGDDDEKSSDRDSNGPQSSVAPSKSLFKNDKPVIYPVSNPVSEAPVDITQFS